MNSFANFVYRNYFGYAITPSINQQTCTMHYKCLN